MITGITVSYNTKALLQRAIESVRAFHPNMKLIVIDGSDSGDPCHRYAASLAGPYTKVVQPGKNVGHGRGMDMALRLCSTQVALVFDSDIVMLRSPVREMRSMLPYNVYGIGWLTQVGEDGFDYGTPGRGHEHQRPVTYLHPYFMLLNVNQYCRFAPFVHHGAPCYKAMLDLHRRDLSETMLVQFPGLTGHTSSEGINWRGQPNPYIQHDFGGTRNNNRLHGQKEIPQPWVR
jgi:glycosyltransferase involved in cell wall biosynthesis